MHRFFSVAAFTCFSILQACGQETGKLAVSPNGKFYVQRRATAANETGIRGEFIDFADAATDKIIFSIRGPLWRQTDAIWSPDGSLVCVNDRVATSGDYTYILEFARGIPVLLKSPNDSLFEQINDIYQQHAGTGRITVVGTKWLSNNSLSLTVAGGGYGDDKTCTALIKYDPKTGLGLQKSSVIFTVRSKRK